MKETMKPNSLFQKLFVKLVQFVGPSQVTKLKSKKTVLVAAELARRRTDYQRPHNFSFWNPEDKLWRCERSDLEKAKYVSGITIETVAKWMGDLICS